MLSHARPAFVTAVLPALAAAAGYHPGPAFPVPTLTSSTATLWPLFNSLKAHLPALPVANTTSFSVHLTSSTETLFSFSHTAPVRGNRSFVNPVTENTAFRVASISKAFTTLAVLQQVHNTSNHVSLSDPITKYLPELAAAAASGRAPVDWEQITLETLGSQLSGIAREYGQSDLGADHSLINHGLPPVDGGSVPSCSKGPEDEACSREEFFDGFSRIPPLFEPNARSTYSNINFVLLGFALENMTDMPYTSLIESNILTPLEMAHTSMFKPDDSHGVIPAVPNHWDWDIGLYKPTGGIYSSASDLSRFERAILNSALLPVAATNSWLKPRSWTSGLNTAYGMPWEILRTTKTTGDGRAINLYTKGGGLDGYYTNIILVPEFGIGLTVLVAGEQDLPTVQEVFVPAVLKGVEEAVRDDVRRRYAGMYTAGGGLNSSLTLAVPINGGLKVERWISNGTDISSEFAQWQRSNATLPSNVELRLFPSGLYRNHSEKQGEIWMSQMTKDETEEDGNKLFADFTLTDVDNFRYAGKSLQEAVFSFDKERMASTVELSGFRVVLYKVEDSKNEKIRSMKDLQAMGQAVLGWASEKLRGDTRAS